MGTRSINKAKTAVRGRLPALFYSSGRLGPSFRPLFFLLVPLFCVLFYAQCATKVEPCNGNPSADPDFDCLPFPPRLLEPEYDSGTGYKIPISIEGADGLDKYEYQEKCYDYYVKDGDISWDGAALQNTAASEKYLDAGMIDGLCFYRMRSCNEYGCGRWSDMTKIVGGLIAPGGVKVDGISPVNGNVYIVNALRYDIVWDALSDPGIFVDHYEYREDELEGRSAGHDTSVTVTKASYGAAYEYRVSTCGYKIENSGDDPETACVWGAPIRVELRLPAPAGLQSDETASYDRVYELSWDAVTGASGYQLQESSDGGGTWSSIADIDGSVSYESRGNAGGAYTYRVRACTLSDTDSLGPGDDVRCSAWSGIAADVTVHALADSSALSSDESGNISTDRSYTVSWTSVAGAAVYVLTEENGGSSAPFAASSGLSQNISGKSYGQSYAYGLKACGGDGSSDDFTCAEQSSTVTVQVKPAVPGSLSLASGTLSPVRDALYTLTWYTVDAGTGTYYEIQERSEAPGSPGFGSWEAAAPSSIDTAVVSAVIDKSAAVSAFQRNYEYQVRACASNAACGDWSGSLALSLQFAKPALALDAAVDSSGSYTLTWNSIAGASQYELEESADGGANWTAVNALSDPAGRRHEVTGKSQGDETEYRLRACRSSACGEWSDALEAEVPSLDGSLALSSGQANEQDRSYTISWSPITADGVDRYRLKEWEEGQSEPADAACQDSSDLSCQDLGDTVLSQSYIGKAYQKSYHYEVRACAGLSVE